MSKSLRPYSFASQNFSCFAEYSIVRDESRKFPSDIFILSYSWQLYNNNMSISLHLYLIYLPDRIHPVNSLKTLKILRRLYHHHTNKAAVLFTPESSDLFSGADRTPDDSLMYVLVIWEPVVCITTSNFKPCYYIPDSHYVIFFLCPEIYLSNVTSLTCHRQQYYLHTHCSICSSIYGSLILLSSAKNSIFVSTSEVFGSSSTNGRNILPRLWECTGSTFIIGPAS